MMLLNLLGVTLVLNGVQSWAIGTVDWLILGLVAIHCGPVLVWQMVGAVRSASAHLSEGGDVALTWGGYVTLLIVVAMTASQSIGSVLSIGYFQAKPLQTMTTLLPVTRDGRDVLLAGGIDYRSRDALLRTLQVHPDVERIVLQSDGGLVFAARAVSEIVLREELDTHVARQCNSACTLVFAAGHRRTMARDASLGFHAYGKVSQFHLLAVDAEAEQAKDAAFLRSRGFREAFLTRIYTHAIDALWRPERQELFAAGVLTEP